MCKFDCLMSSLRALRRMKTFYRPLLASLGADWTVAIPRTFPSTPVLQEWPFNPRWLTTAKEGDAKRGDRSKQSLMINQEEEEDSSITDQIPAKPMTAAEGVSYTAIILAAFAVFRSSFVVF